MADLAGFRAEDHAALSVERKVVPAGTYRGVFIQSERRTSRAGNDFLEMVFEVTEGECKGHRFWDNMNIWHPKEQVVEIAKARLASACRATGIIAPRDSQELHDRPVAAIVVVRPRKDNGEPQNEITSYAAVAPTPSRKVQSMTPAQQGVAAALAGKASSAKPAAPAGGGDDEDLPF